MAEDPGLRKRGRTSEDDYFSRRDRELIETKRRQEADAAELRRLGEALEVAWSDGAVGKAEGDLLKEQLRRYSDAQQPSAEAVAMLDQFLLARPPDRLFDRARRAAQVAVSGAGGRDLATRIVADARAVAEAAGGMLGLGTVSAPERRALESLAAALGVSSNPNG